MGESGFGAVQSRGVVSSSLGGSSETGRPEEELASVSRSNVTLGKGLSWRERGLNCSE